MLIDKEYISFLTMKTKPPSREMKYVDLTGGWVRDSSVTGKMAANIIPAVSIPCVVSV